MTNLYIGDYNLYKKEFTAGLEQSGIFINKPGHYVFENKPLDMDAVRDFVEWYNSNTGVQDGDTAAILAPSFIKDATQQLLLKIFEEPRTGYKIHFFVPSGANVLETIRSRCFVNELPAQNKTNTLADEFLNKTPGERLNFIEKEIKKLEASEVREYAERLTRELCTKYQPSKNKDEKMKTEACLKASLALNLQRIPPRYILEHLAFVL